MTKAIFAGVATILAALGAWFAALHFAVVSGLTGLLFWLAIGLSGLTAAWIAPRRKILIGVSMAFPSSLLLGLSSLAYEALGHSVDFSGIAGATTIFLVSLPFHAALCAVGALLGKLGAQMQIARSDRAA